MCDRDRWRKSTSAMSIHWAYLSDWNFVPGATSDRQSTKRSQTSDQHAFTRSISFGQCMVCHMHPATNMLTTYFGVTWWDNEIDGEKDVSPRSRKILARQNATSRSTYPEAAAARGLGVIKIPRANRPPEFTNSLRLRNSLFSWPRLGVPRRYAHDRKGDWLDRKASKIAFADPTFSGKAVILPTVTSKGNAVYGLPLWPGQSWKRKNLMASHAPPLKLIASTATAPSVRVRALVTSALPPL